MSARNVGKYFAAAILILGGAAVLYGQQNGGMATIEELYLSQDIDLQVARSQALGENREMKLLALQTLRSMIDEGMADTAGPEITAILNVLATEGTSRQVRTGNNTVINNFPDIRRQAVELLWQVGGNGAEEAMKGVLRDDPEPMVLAEAVYGLGMMEISNPEEVAEHLVYLLRRWNAMPAPDNNLAFSTLLTVERLAQQHPEIASNPELINTLLGIASGNYIREVRLKSIDVISGLRHRGR
ncbi:HEAT repeat domain-containing protein [Spirochaeta africana]|uniref:HEAT repeat domain-containing protein n=1 Tax=Spirochaeta africana (strain ATCC 700263 / DSM 8902 / Z-7692) TaxID=889378 RepID=H9UHD4_SPIAZ|nr:HEAT repeat domain-containing protein [Spirochaeta africana]AFG36927.1 hypothetical protein Spiaf_0834 [Spirochaeta africana DSM 8902]